MTDPAPANAAGVLLAARGLTCVRDRRVLFENLSFAVGAGDILYIEGANGAGKTSLLRLLCGLLAASEGEVRWRGVEALTLAGRPEYFRELLYIGHSPALKDDLNALENLGFLRSLGGHPGEPEAALAAVGLEGFEDLPVRMLSAGQRRRVALSRLWLSDATLWLLDEPLTALDVHSVARLETRLAEHAGAGGVVLLTSHQPLNLPGVRRLALHGDRTWGGR